MTHIMHVYVYGRNISTHQDYFRVTYCDCKFVGYYQSFSMNMGWLVEFSSMEMFYENFKNRNLTLNFYGRSCIYVYVCVSIRENFQVIGIISE